MPSPPPSPPPTAIPQKILAILLYVRCDKCGGKGLVPGGQREYGEVTRCIYCRGEGMVPFKMDFKAFLELLKKA